MNCGAQGQSAGDPDPLALTAGELVGVAASVIVLQPHLTQHVEHGLKALFGCADVVDVQPFADGFADGHARIERGIRVLEDDLQRSGAWRLQVVALAASRISTPPIRTEPLVGSIRRSIERPTVVLPHPDSPTRPSVSPLRMVKLTLSTACTQADDALQHAASHREVLHQLADFDQVLRALLRELVSLHGAARSDGERGLMPLGFLVQPTANGMTRSDLEQVRLLFGADRQLVPELGAAARGEAASGRQVHQIGDDSRDDFEPILDQPQHGHRGGQALRVGMKGLVEQRQYGGLLDDASGIHHRHTIRHLGDDAQVVRDQDDAGVTGAAHLPHQIEDLGLDGHVERCGGFIGNQ